MERRRIDPALLKPVVKKNTRVKDSKALNTMPDDSELVFGKKTTEYTGSTETTKPKDKPLGYVFGRPTAYRSVMCEQVVEWGRQGLSKTQMCAKLMISRECLYEWERTHTDFSDALALSLELSQAWWEDKAHTGITQPSSAFNTGLFSKVASCRFHRDYREVTNKLVGGIEGAAPIPVAVASAQVTGENLADFYKGIMDSSSSQ